MKSFADFKKILDEKAHTVPKTEKEKDLAALAEPKDKITHADVMVGRGVKKEEVSTKDTSAKEKANKDLPFEPDEPKKSPSAIAGKYGQGYSTARHLARQGMKSMTKEEFEQLEEKTKTTMEDPLVTVHDKDGLHTQANLSTANKIFNTNVKHTEVHKGPVTVTSGREDKNKLKFAVSKHNAAAMKESAELEEKTLTPAELKKREEIARAMERDNPDMPMGKKMAIATAQAKKVAEEVEELDEGMLSSIAGKLAKSTGVTPKDVANSTISALNKKAPGTVMHGHPNFSKFKQAVHDHISAAKDAEEAMKRSSDSHIMSLAKKHFTEEVSLDEISSMAHAKYRDAARKDIAANARGMGNGSKDVDAAMDKIDKRVQGLSTSSALELKGKMSKASMKEAISYSDFKDKIEAHRKAGNKVVDDKYNYSTGTATYTTIDKEGYGRKVTHTDKGQKMENLGKVSGDDDEADVKTTEKRGRGRPAGSKSGARRHN